MRTAILILSLVVFASCSKDKFTNEPQLEFKRFDRDQWVGPIFTTQEPPHMIVEVTDGDGDLGFIAGQDTAFVYLKNLLNGDTDSLAFPNLASAAKKNFKADIEISIASVMTGRPGNPPRPYSDTLYFEVYVKDFAKNKSNVVLTSEPFYLITP